MITGAIFDLDGTLLDSSGFWDLAPAAYLRTQGKEPRPGLAQAVFPMTVPEAAAYMIREYGLDRTPDEITSGVNAAMERFYLHDIPLKDGAAEAVRALAERHVPLAIASVTDKSLVEAVLRRFGLAGAFAWIVTTGEVGAGKSEPDVYLRAAERIGSTPENTLVFEDALHALRTANRAGFRTVGIYDTASEGLQEQIRAESAFYLRSFAEIGSVLRQLDN